ncbi:MarR family transcriptional regulator [Pseudaminobacter sp. 19-2017]|uniref:MarR family transcriptional regulator n=1 Tax=Pseudaminobacter soli (ex Zhang et al. 2022) TaxID=2831468 RepID=A0A942DUI8_9HYPH|nr:MarR family transcriptional regulator [Pseudaminobacter soli]MBS3647214.1 MarR family transcriptional regulator [Pseudaminobacter soli]
MATTQNTLAALRAELLEELSVTGRKLRTLFDARVRAKGLTLGRARTLMHIARRDGMTQTELAEFLEVEGPTLVRLLDGLESQGLIERRPVEGDRRAKQIVLTKDGHTLAAEVTRLANELREEVLADIPEAELIAAAETIRAIARKISIASDCQTHAA